VQGFDGLAGPVVAIERGELTVIDGVVDDLNVYSFSCAFCRQKVTLYIHVCNLPSP
jgi:hypothetical protein